MNIRLSNWRNAYEISESKFETHGCTPTVIVIKVAQVNGDELWGWIGDELRPQSILRRPNRSESKRQKTSQDKASADLVRLQRTTIPSLPSMRP